MVRIIKIGMRPLRIILDTTDQKFFKNIWDSIMKAKILNFTTKLIERFDAQKNKTCEINFTGFSKECCYFLF